MTVSVEPTLDWYHDGTGLASMSSLPTFLPKVVLFAVFGFWLPWQKGASFLDPVVLGAYASLGVVFSAPAVASGISVFKAVRNGLLLSWGMLLSGVAVIYVTRPVPVGPDLLSLAECGLFGLFLSLAASLIVAYAASKLLARLLLLVLLVLFYFWSGWLPEVALIGAAASAGVAVVFGLLLRKQ
jgi:hypothetical protein